MKGDFSRLTFDPLKHYSGVRMQQGRVQMDADWNENLDILRHRIETETIDVIGQCGVPVHDAGFGVVTDFSSLSSADQALMTSLGFGSLAGGDFYLTGGRAYVDGLLVENDHTLPASQQPFVLPKGVPPLSAEGIYLLYLDIWERHMTALEDPSIREVALGGPDTATRSQIIWQAFAAQVGSIGDTITCDNTPIPWTAPSTGTLTAQTVPQTDPSDPCAVPLGAGYKRLENQLYRVEIHLGSTNGGPTYKWSRDNGSVLVAAKEFPVNGNYAQIRTSSLGRDDVLGLHENDWVEVIDDATELAGLPGSLVQITKIDPDNLLTLSANLPNTFLVLDAAGNPTHLKVRRWDSDGSGGNGLALSGSFVDLEGGIQIKFDLGGTYRTGDYWLIPARTVPGQYGDIEWPVDSAKNPLPLLPFGITHHFCKLAILSAQAGPSGALTVTLVEDCRKEFPPLTELPTGGDHCCSVTVGQGGDYPDLLSALNARPIDATWWTICILPGVLSLSDTLNVDGAQSLTFSGCGAQSRLIGPTGKPVISFTNGQDIELEGLRIDANSPGGAVLFSDGTDLTVQECTILNAAQVVSAFGVGGGKPVGPGLVIDNGTQVEIRDNSIFGLPSVQANGSQLDILHNRLMGGGIQIIPPSKLITIDANTILKGFGAGIQLGGGDKTAGDFVTMYYTDRQAAPAPGAKNTDAAYGGSNPGLGMVSQVNNSVAATRYVRITRNLIGEMNGSGIITETSFTTLSSLGDVESLLISENQILLCCETPEVTLNEVSSAGGGIAILGVFNAQILGNTLAWNGLKAPGACGIFVLDGSDVEIGDNQVLENGSVADQDTPTAYQAGIAAKQIFGNFLSSASRDASGALLGYPALRIHDNLVVCAAGQALTVTCLGSVQVDGNSFATRERKKQPSGPLNFGVHGACVYINDMGLPIWYPDLATLLQFASGGTTALHMESFQQADVGLTGYPDGRVLFQNNVVTFNTDVQETVASLGQTIDNLWWARAWNAATFSTLIHSLDDVSLNGNQFQSSVPLYLQLGMQAAQAGNLSGPDLLAYFLKFLSVGTVGSTVRAANNGLAERLGSNLVSYGSTASFMNATTGNETTHILLAFAPKNVEANNLNLWP